MNGLRCVVLLLLAALLGACQLVTPHPVAPPKAAPTPKPAAYWPTTGWRSSPPEAYGIDSAKLAEALLTMRGQNINIHSLMVIRDGQVLVDAYLYPYDGSTVHDLASVTKSVMTTLIAIAADQGKLQLDAPMVSFFPDRTIANLDARKERITVRHLASMASGLECMGFAQDEGTLRAMQASPDWVQFALDRPAVAEPGTQFVYDSPGMHLLSAILQQATGMTALAFAQENLFTPLGIKEVLWESDPQGYTDGWGDLYLHPRDAAKLGYLWLNQGVWEGRQIVPEAWVEAAQQVQMQVAERDDDYGYGWWITPGEGVYTAAGRGGQYVKVVPWLNVIVTATGGGFDYEEIDPLLSASLVDPNHPLPANPEGAAQLEATVAAIVQPPAPQPLAPLPDTAREITGKTFVFDANPVELETLSIEFGAAAEATLHFRLAGSDQVLSAPVGLDGVYRLSPGDHGLPQGYRGRWADAQTFVLEYDNIANNDHIFYQAQFKDGRIVLGVQETAHELGVQIEGRLQTP